MRVLLTVLAWGVLSFLFTWFWGTATSRLGDSADGSSQVNPSQAAT